ncbi:MAG: hypothetical protein CMH49_10470 [Myxococcales bacterium]|nr:hypothetical protein [Myxococcales bacterium]
MLYDCLASYLRPSFSTQRDAFHLNLFGKYLSLGLCLLLVACVETVESGTNVINPGLSEPGGTEVTGGMNGGESTGGRAMLGSGRPVLMRIGDKVAVVGELLSIQLMASDPENDVVNFSLRSALPDGAKFEKDRGLFTWTPTQDQIGSVLLTFEVSDGTLKDQETIAVTVSAAGSQEQFPPKIDPIGSLLINAGEPWRFQLVGEDLNNQALTYRLNGMIPNGLMLDAMSGLITWTPAESQIGQYNLVASVSDGESEDSTPMVIIVQDAGSQSSSNRPPVFDALAPQQVMVGQMLVFEISAMDEMPANLVYQAQEIPDGAEFIQETKRFSWTPIAAQGGISHDAIFTVTDGEFQAFLSVSIEVTVMLRDCPQDPTGMSGGTSPLAEGQRLDNRVLCDQTEIDNYEITLDRMGVIEATANFQHNLGDIDLYLYNSANQRIGVADGFSDEERLISPYLPAGAYRLEVKMYTGDGPSTYSVVYTVQDNVMVCEPDSLEGAGNNSVNTASPISAGQNYSLGLCRNDIDYYTFNAQRADQITINSIFSHTESDIDIRLSAPNDSGGNPLEAWYSSSPTDNEQIIVPSAPFAGTYTLEIRQVEADREASYDLRVDVESPGACEADRFESYDEAENSYPLGLELYRDLRACADEDWFETIVDPGRALILYLTYDGGTPTVNAQNAFINLNPVSQNYSEPVDGCVTDRSNCRRYLIDPGLSGGLVQYSISFLEVGVDYDLRVRMGDEVGAPCFDELDCNLGYECIYEFNSYSFEYGLCSKPCNSDADCGSNRVCATDDFGSQQCMQRCDNGLSCRYEFTCNNTRSVSGSNVQACLSDTFND